MSSARCSASAASVAVAVDRAIHLERSCHLIHRGVVVGDAIQCGCQILPGSRHVRVPFAEMRDTHRHRFAAQIDGLAHASLAGAYDRHRRQTPRGFLVPRREHGAKRGQRFGDIAIRVVELAGHHQRVRDVLEIDGALGIRGIAAAAVDLERLLEQAGRLLRFAELTRGQSEQAVVARHVRMPIPAAAAAGGERPSRDVGGGFVLAEVVIDATDRVQQPGLQQRLRRQRVGAQQSLIEHPRHRRVAILDDVGIAGFEEADDKVGHLAGFGRLLPFARRRLLHLARVLHAERRVADERGDSDGSRGERDAMSPRKARGAIGERVRARQDRTSVEIALEILGQVRGGGVAPIGILAQRHPGDAREIATQLPRQPCRRGLPGLGNHVRGG